MKERMVHLNILGTPCSINQRGRMVVGNPEDPHLSITGKQLEILILLASGYTYGQASLIMEKKESYLRHQAAFVRRNNNQRNIAGVIGIAAEFDLLNVYAVEGIRQQVRRLSEDTQPIDVTGEFMQVEHLMDA